MTSRIDRALYTVAAQTGGYRESEARLYEYLRAVLDPTCYVSFSAGKDSMVLAHAAQAICPEIPILMVDPGCPTHWLEREKSKILAYTAARGWNLILFPWDKWACVGEERDPDEAARKIHGNMFTDLTRYAADHGLATRLLGLRAEESRGRKISLLKYGLDAQLRDGTRRIIPLARWRTDWIWAYTVKHDLPWLEIYDRVGPDARNGLIGVHGASKGRLEYLKYSFPDAWRAAKKLLPCAEILAR
jgi:3'-phosphoadenosine 5'-phosphosulfate sulfotransferase (PAPS reductase)/FAD synthetase